MGFPMRYPAELKAIVALEALRGEASAAQLATKYKIRASLVVKWKHQAMAGMVRLFALGDPREPGQGPQAKAGARPGESLLSLEERYFFNGAR